MPWTFSGIMYPAQLVYTQHTGFDPDVAQATCLPQTTQFPSAGTLILSWGNATLSLPNCVVDVASLELTPNGRFLQLMILDRRERWRRSVSVHGEYNTRRVNALRVSNQKTLRQLGQLLMTALGEPSADVSALPTDVYPAVVWDHVPALDAARELLEPLGYSVALGFGSEPVKVVKLGQSTQVLSTTDKFIGTDSIDPKESPRWVRNVFSPTFMQARFLLEAVGLELDKTWKPIDQLSYMPAAGWGTVAPESLMDEDNALTAAQTQAAQGYVRRAYRIKGFVSSNGSSWTTKTSSWTLPDGSGVVSGMEDVLPLQNRVLDTWNIRPGMSYESFRLYGKRTRSSNDRMAVFDLAESETTSPTDLLPEVYGYLDGENGVVTFDTPIFLLESNLYKPAELVLECAFSVRDQSTYALRQYVKDVEIAPAGSGYFVQKSKARQEVKVQYGAMHNPTTSTSNQAALDADAAVTAQAISGRYPVAAAQQIVYSQPQLGIRNDGQVLQLQHIFTNGEDHAVNRTIISRNYEFDRGIASRSRRLTTAYSRSALESGSIRQLDAAEGFAAND